MMPTGLSTESYRQMLHLIAEDLGVHDPYNSVNPVTLVREIRSQIKRLKADDKFTWKAGEIDIANAERNNG